MTFRTQYDAPVRVLANPGFREKQLYGPVFDDKGVLHLAETGVHDLYGEIQSHAQSVDIHVLLQRYQNGDVEALSRMQGAYGDFTEMPKTFAEALNTMLAAEQYFSALPPDVRSRFNNSYHQFISSFDSPSFLADAGLDFGHAAEDMASAETSQAVSQPPPDAAAPSA